MDDNQLNSVVVKMLSGRTYQVIAPREVSIQRMDAAVRRQNPYARIVTGTRPDNTNRGNGSPKVQVRIYSV